MNLKRISLVAVVLIAVAAIMFLVGCAAPTGTQQQSTEDQSSSQDESSNQKESSPDASLWRPWWLAPPQPAAPQSVSPGNGTKGENYYSFWISPGASGVTMTMDGEGYYTADCNNTNGGFVAGIGWGTTSTNRVINYNGKYHSSFGGAFGVYGWTKNALIEYYVCEKTGDVEGPHNSGEEKNGNGHFKVGSVYSDGGMYDIYSHFRDGFLSIEGENKQFWQYISVRRDPRTIGTITFQNHVNEWANCYKDPNNHSKGKMVLGSNKTGNLCYQILFTEMWSRQYTNGDPMPGYSVHGESEGLLTDYQERKTSFNAFYNNKYLKLQSDNNVYANGNNDSEARSTWYICFIDLNTSNGRVAFRSPVNGKYLSVASNGNVTATSDTVGTNETFQREDFYGYNYFKSLRTNKYLFYDGDADTVGRSNNAWRFNWIMDQEN